MPSERMEFSPTTDADMNDSSLSFLESVAGLPSTKDDSMLLSDSMNANTDFKPELNTEIDPEDLLDITFEKSDINLGSIEGVASNVTPTKPVTTVQQQFSILNNNGQTKSKVQSPVCNFVTAVSPAKAVELPTLRTTITNSNKPNTPQFLIFQKPTGNIPVLVSKNITSPSNVAIVQPSTIVSSGAKILTLPTINTAGGLLSAVTPTGTGKSGDVKILLSGVPCATSFVTSKPIISSSVSNSSTTLQGPLKRAVTPSSTGQMVTKVIITNNAGNNQTLQLSPVPVSASGTTPIAVSQPQSILLASPNKSVTLPRNVFNISSSQQIIKTLPGTPPKQFFLSPVKPVQKGLTYAPVTYSKSPRRIAPATNTTISTLGAGNKVATVLCPTTVTSAVPSQKVSIPQSPTKVLIKPMTQPLLKPHLLNTNSNLSSTTFTTAANVSVTPTSHVTQTASAGNASQIQVSGNKFHYVRLVSAATTSTVTPSVTTKKEPQTLMSGTSLSTTVTGGTAVVTVTNSSQVRPTVPIAPAKLVAPKQVGQKILIPPANSQIRAVGSTASQLGQLPTGTLIPVAGSGSSNYVMVSAQYVTQLQQPSASSGTQMLNILPAPTPPSSSAVGGQSAFITVSSNPPNTFNSNTSAALHSSSHHSNRRAPVDVDSRQRKPCNCTKSQCLKLYCDCFANGEFCHNCNCNNCYNNLTHEEERQKAIKACLDRNPLAFHPKIGKSREGDHERRHTKGCNCKRSGCLKNYCECYEAKILCTNLCKCIGCKNFEDSSERKTLMHLADAAEVRVQQQIAAKTNLSSEILDIPSKPPVMSRTGERLPFAFVTDDVLEATCLCLLAHASDAEKSHSSEEEIEKLVLEEFGRCLKRIIDCANKTKVTKMDIQ